MKYVSIFVLFLLMIGTISAYDLTVNIYRADGSTPHYCNPCSVELFNETAYIGNWNYTTSTETIPDYSHTFTGLASGLYTIDADIDLIGYVYEKKDYVTLVSNDAIDILAPIDDLEKLATIDTNDKSIDGITLLTAKQLGYDSLNQFNGNSPYTYTDAVPSSEFTSYDVIVVGGSQFISPQCVPYPIWEKQVSDQIKTAIINSGAFVIVPVGHEKLWDFLGVENVTRSFNGAIVGSNYKRIIYFSSTDADYQYFWNTNTTGTGLLREWYQSSIYTSPSVNDRVCQASPNITSGLASEYVGSRVCLNTTLNDACVDYTGMSISNRFIVLGETSGYRSASATDYDLPVPVFNALVYHSIRGADLYNLELNVYEGTEECGNINPLNNVMCCISTGCGVSSPLTSEIIHYSSGVSALNPFEITERGDATDVVMFWDSEEAFHDYIAFGFPVQSWEKEFIQLGNDAQAWMLYRDDHKSRISFAGSRGSTDGEEHWLLDYDFYNSYYDTALLDNISFSVDALDNRNSGSLDFERNLGLDVLHTCENGDYWNMSVYFGINTSNWNEYELQCNNGALSRSTTYSLTAIPDFDMTTIDWVYGYAPEFILRQGLIGYNDTIPMKKIQSNHQGATYNWIRQMIVSKFTPKYESGTGINTDTGGFIILENSTLYYDYIKYSGGNISLRGSGNEVLTCTAPSGYSFYDSLAETFSTAYERNVTIETDISLGIMLQELRDLRMSIHITSFDVEDIDNARCSIQGFTDSYSTNGYCYFNNVQPNTQYNITVRTSGAESKIVHSQKYVKDYYDSFDVDNDKLFCGNFDGTYKFEINVDVPAMTFIPHVVLEDGSSTVANAIVNADGKECKTNIQGYCTIILDIQQGLELEVNISKHPQIVSYSKRIYTSEMDCTKDFVCIYYFYVSANASYDGTVNDDTIFSNYLGGDLDVFQAITIVMEMISKPMFLGLLILACITVVLGYWLGAIGVVVGLTTGVLLTLSMGLIPVSFALGYFITLALIVAVFLRSGFVEVGGNFGGGGN